MRYSHYIVLFVGLALLSNTSYGQRFPTVDEFKPKSPAEYSKYEPEILRCIEFLEEAPFDSEGEARKNASAFFVLWLTGTPAVTIHLRDYVMDLAEENQAFVITYMGGWTKEALRKKGDVDSLSLHLAGVQSVLRVYKSGRGVKEDSNLDDLIALSHQPGKLQEWLKEQLDN